MLDATALIDLDGRGVRELTRHDGSIWVIAGPPQDDTHAAFALWRFPVGELAAGATIEPVHVAPLPNGAEGLAIHGTSAIVLMDGDEAGEGSRRCRVDATYVVVPL